MAFDCSYQGIPAESKTITMALEDQAFAEEAFYHLIAFSCLDDEEDDGSTGPMFERVTEVYQNHPQLRQWNYQPVSRAHDALVYTLDPEAYRQAQSYAELEKTFPYQFVMGEKVFSQDLKATQGAHVRFSSPEFIKRCAEYAKSIDMEVLEKNFNGKVMASLGVYKTFEHSEFEWVRQYFEGLADFYHKMSALNNISVFIIQD